MGDNKHNSEEKDLNEGSSNEESEPKQEALQLVENLTENEVNDQSDQSEDDSETLQRMLENPELILESLIFSSSEPLPASRLKQILRGAKIDNFPKLIEELNQKYESQNRVYRIEKIAKGYVLMTLPDYAPWLKKLQKQKVDNRLSQAALETLAIISYRQPLTRAEIDAIRGVSSGPLLKSLIDKGLLRIAGQAEVIGRPLLYGTTQKFLDTFSLADLNELPKLSDKVS